MITWSKSEEYFVNKIPLHPHKFTLLYNFFSTSVMINFYLYLPDFLTQVFLLTSLKKTRWILRPAQEELQREGCREKTTKKLSWSLTPTLSPLRLPFVKVQRDSTVHTVPHSSQLSCRAVQTVSTLHTSDFQFSHDTDSQDVLSNWSSINKMQNFKYKIYNNFYDFKIYIFFD